MCVFCVRIRIFKRLCAMYAALWDLSGLCIQIRLLHLERILSKVFVNCSTYRWSSIWMISDSSDVVMTVVMDVIWFIRRYNDRRDGFFPIRLMLWWPSWWMFSDSSNVVITVVMDVVRFVRSCDDRRDRCCPIRQTLGWPSWLCDRLDWSSQRIRPKDTIFWAFFSNYLMIRLNHPCRSVFRVPRTFAIERPILTLDRLFDDEQ